MSKSFIYLLSFIIILLCLLATPSNQWNERVKCRALQSILTNPRLSSLKVILLRSNMTQYLQVEQASQRLISKHQRSIPYIEQQPYPEINCQNFHHYNQSCCQRQDFQNYSQQILQIYEKYVFNDVKYPIFSHLFNISQKIVENNCYLRSNGSLTTAQHIGYPENILENIQKHNEQIQALIAFERKFIKQSLCLMCLGVRDFPNFLRPDPFATNNPSLTELHFNIYIINRQYFQESVQTIYNIYMQLEKMHIQMRNYIMSMAENIPSKARSSNSECNELYQTNKNYTFVNRLKVCEYYDGRTCKKLAVRYFGEPAAPQNVRYIKLVNSNIGIAQGGWDYYLSENGGFAGNSTQYANLYGSYYMQDVKKYVFPDYEGLWEKIYF